MLKDSKQPQDLQLHIGTTIKSNICVRLANGQEKVVRKAKQFKYKHKICS